MFDPVRSYMRNIQFLKTATIFKTEEEAIQFSKIDAVYPFRCNVDSKFKVRIGRVMRTESKDKRTGEVIVEYAFHSDNGVDKGQYCERLLAIEALGKTALEKLLNGDESNEI